MEVSTAALRLLGACGFAGAALMLAADLVLYLPAERALRSADVYFARIDAAGDELDRSPMGAVSDSRLMLGGVLGPLAALLYAVGFLQARGPSPAAAGRRRSRMASGSTTRR